jgi:hypothetical protein
MKNKSNHILYCTAKLPVLLLYFCFFVVQLSFNFDTGGDNNKTPLTAWQNNDVSIKTKASQHAEKANTNKQNSVNIRLNKRFQPEKAICCNAVTVKLPLYCLIEKPGNLYISKIASPTAFNSHTLRGPPMAVA